MGCELQMFLGKKRENVEYQGIPHGSLKCPLLKASLERVGLDSTGQPPEHTTCIYSGGLSVQRGKCTTQMLIPFAL